MATPNQYRFSIRFRKISNRYPLRVSEAYNYDHEAALRDDDLTVARRVREWELDQGLVPRDWISIGKAERDET